MYYTFNQNDLHLILRFRGKGGKGGAPVVVVPDEPKEKMLCGSNCISAVSKAICIAGAEAQGCPLYEYISSLKYGQVC